VNNPEACKPVKVEYAADLSSQVYGSAFKSSSKPQASDAFKLNNINKQRNSLMQALKNKQQISGITEPWLYLGMLFSTFC